MVFPISKTELMRFKKSYLTHLLQINGIEFDKKLTKKELVETYIEELNILVYEDSWNPSATN